MQLEISRNFWPYRFFGPSLLEDEEEWLLPSTDVISGLSMSEDDKNVFVEASLPGIEPKDIEVTFDKGVLWVRGLAKEEEEDKQLKYYRKASRSFSYRLAIPETVDEASEPVIVSKNGVLKATFEKVTKSQPKRLPVKVV